MEEIFMMVITSSIIFMMYYSPNFCRGYERRTIPVNDPDVISVEVCDVSKEPSFEKVNLRTIDVKRLRELDRQYAGTEIGKRIHNIRRTKIEGLLYDRKRKHEETLEKQEIVSSLNENVFDFGKLSLSELRRLIRIGERE
jgi:hypothetical protein